MGKRETITEALRERVVAQHEPDAHLTSVQSVRREFGVSTGTAVAAMADLQAAGYVYSSQRGYFMASTLPATEREDEQRAVVAALRGEARRLQEIADRLDRTISS